MDKPKLAIIHTTVATVEPLRELANELLPNYEVINFVDDSILPQLARNGSNLQEVENRLIQYARFAEEVGAEAILNACSSVGEVVAVARRHVNIPFVRIDEAMAEEAIQRGERIGVAATLSTTLQPTVRLLEEKAANTGKQVKIEAILVAEAYQKLMAGDKEGHDTLLIASLVSLARSTEVVVLAQASMARVLPQLPENERRKFLSSPRLAMEQVSKTLAGAKR